MSEPSLQQDAAFREAFLTAEQQERVNTGKIAAALVVFLMPAGVILDKYYTFVVENEYLGYFLNLRLACSALAAIIWFLFTRPLGRRYYRLLGLAIAWLPAAFMSWMIAVSEGPNSPYYAGLNLVLLAVSAVVHWSTRESIIAVLGVLRMYGAACLAHGGSFQVAAFISNVYFITLTGLVVVVGNHIFNRLRLREFRSSYELDQNRKILQAANQKLVELDQVKNRFFANISHELRTPLTLLLAPLETLIHRSGRSIGDATREVLLTMRSNGMRLLKLINDLLDLVRLESGRIEVKPEPLDLGNFIKGLASAARQVADDKRIQLETVIDPALGSILADRDKLEKVLLNLVFNALKFTPAGGRVEIRAELREPNFLLAVTDTGMGIAEENLPFIFDRFWQADTSSKRKYQGVGIGLSLVKQLIELQGGSVTVQSKEGQGATFHITLPHAPAELAAPTPSADASEPAADGEPPEVRSEEWLSNLYRRAELFPALTPIRESVRPVETWSDGKRPRLLIADDEPDMLRFLRSQLKVEYEILEAVDGQQAIEKASHFLPDIILLDMMMPEKNGIEACRELRERTPTQNIPIVLLTARADEGTKMDALSVGASDFLTKPFSTTELHVRLKNLVQSYQYQRKLAKQNQVLERTIEQLKETESRLVEGEKLRSLGQLSAGMIHEINNPLNFAITGLFSLRSKAKLVPDAKRPEYQETVADVEEGIKRVKDLVSKMREFSYADNQHVDQVEIADVVESALRFLSHECNDKVEVHKILEPGQTVLGNKNRLTQVLLNLLQNSLDALNRKTFTLDKPAIWIEGRTEADRTVLVIRDNGDGIMPEHLDKVFDPFFTTKDVGQGMGLGLSICYRIVQDYSGRFHIRSEPGQFCEFKLEFPISHPCGASAGVATEGTSYGNSF